MGPLLCLPFAHEHLAGGSISVQDALQPLVGKLSSLASKKAWVTALTKGPPNPAHQTKATYQELQLYTTLLQIYLEGWKQSVAGLRVAAEVASDKKADEAARKLKRTMSGAMDPEVGF